MPSITLGQLVEEVYGRLEDNRVFYSAKEVKSAINEAISITNLQTGILQDTETIFSIANRCIYDLPDRFLLPVRVSFEGVMLEGYGIEAATYSLPLWMKEKSAQQGIPPAHWIMIGTQKFGINPADSFGGRAIQIVGVIEPEELELDSQTMPLPNQCSGLVTNYAAHILQLDIGGGQFQQSLPLFQGWAKGVADLSIYERARSRTTLETERIKS